MNATRHNAARLIPAGSLSGGSVWTATIAILAPWRVRRLLWLLATRIGFLAVVLQAYSYVRKTYFQRDPEVAFAHAIQIADLQSALQLAVTDVELQLQRRVLEHPWLIDAFNAHYRTFKPALYVCASICLILAPVAFRRIRRAFLIATLIALPWYALYPLAPPRLMEPFGYPFVDTIAVYGGAAPSSAGWGGANQFAAMPSMHVAWTTIAALWLAAALPWRRIGATLGCLHLLVMCLTVVVTGNHYVLDIVGGLVVAGLSVALATALPGNQTVRAWAARRRSRGGESGIAV